MSDLSTRKIRVLIVVPEAVIPIWLSKLIDNLQDANTVDVQELVAITDNCNVTESSTLLRFWQMLDWKLFLRNQASTADILCKEVPLHDLPLQDSDLVAWMCPYRPPADLISKAKFGFLTIANALRPDYGLAEFVSREPATECQVVRFGESPKNDQLLATGAVRTDPLSLARGLTELYAAGNTLFVTTLSRPTYQDSGAPVPLPRKIGTPRILARLAAVYLRYLFQFPRRFFSFDQWQLAYRIGGARLDQNGLSTVAPDHVGGWADPFIVEHKGHRVLFFEDISAELDRGHIAAMELQADGQFSPPISALVRPYHLSYPFLLEFDGSLFMIPESAEAGRVEAFICTEFPNRWEPYTTLLDGVQAYDPTIVEHDGMWWMFMTMKHEGNSSDHALHLYYAEHPFGQWIPHPLNPIGLDVRTSRPAGQMFRENGRLYRPAQDCSGRYGRAIVIREVLRMTTTEYHEVTANTISSTWAGNAHATHTVNQSADVTVYDYQVRRRRKLGLGRRPVVTAKQ